MPPRDGDAGRCVGETEIVRAYVVIQRPCGA
jgi:hypothetical protein